MAPSSPANARTGSSRNAILVARFDAQWMPSDRKPALYRCGIQRLLVNVKSYEDAGIIQNSLVRYSMIINMPKEGLRVLYSLNTDILHWMTHMAQCGDDGRVRVMSGVGCC